jgi:hypothetical protein
VQGQGTTVHSNEEMVWYSRRIAVIGPFTLVALALQMHLMHGTLKADI